MIPRHRIVKDPKTQRPLGVIMELAGPEYDPVFSGEVDWVEWMYCSQGVALTMTDQNRRLIFADADSKSRSILEAEPKKATDLVCSVVVNLDRRIKAAKVQP